MRESGLCTRVRGTARVGSAVADTPQSGRGRDSKETAAWSSVFSPGRVRRASARESPCQTPEIGRQKVTGGSGVTVSLRVGSRPREASRRPKQRDLTVPLSQKPLSDTWYKRAYTCLTRSTKDAARAAHAQVQPHVKPTWFHSHTHTHSVSHSLTLTHTHTHTERGVEHSATSAPCTHGQPRPKKPRRAVQVGFCGLPSFLRPYCQDIGIFMISVLAFRDWLLSGLVGRGIRSGRVRARL